MAQQLVGYRLVAGDGDVIQSWGGAWGQYPSVPDVLALPNGDRVHCPQVGATYGEWTLNDWRMDPPTLTPAEIAAAAIAAGVAIVSTSTPALNGTYAVDDASRANTVAIMTGVAAGLGLPGSGATFTYFDMSNAAHTFTAQQFGALAAALRDYVYALDLYAAGAGSLPTSPVTIA